MCETWMGKLRTIAVRPVPSNYSLPYDLPQAPKREGEKLDVFIAFNERKDLMFVVLEDHSRSLGDNA